MSIVTLVLSIYSLVVLFRIIITWVRGANLGRAEEIIGAVVVIYKTADSDGKSGLIWGALALALCVLSLVLPWPILRVILAFVLAFTALFAHNVINK